MKGVPIAQQRCFNHEQREAVARCPECLRFFCRECITEHDDRVICAACLRKLVRRPFSQRGGFILCKRVAQCALGFLAGWFFFYLVGEALLAIPSSFHEGTLWQVPWLEKQ